MTTLTLAYVPWRKRWCVTSDNEKVPLLLRESPVADEDNCAPWDAREVMQAVRECNPGCRVVLET